MTFRPSDDVLEEISADAQLSNTPESLDYSEGVSSSQGDRLFYKADDIDQSGENTQNNSDEINTFVVDEPVEEIQTPDLSELLKDTDTIEGNQSVKEGGDQLVNQVENQPMDQPENQPVAQLENQLVEENTQTIGVESDITQSEQVEQDFSIDLSGIQSEDSQSINLSEDVQQNVMQNVENLEEQNGVENLESQENNSKSSNEASSFDGKMSDVERANIVSEIEGSVHSNLDFLVDEQWSNVVRNYKKMHRIIFRRGIFIFASILGLAAGIFVQVKASQSGKVNIINDSLIYNMNNFSDEFTVTELSELRARGIDFLIPYGFSRVNGNELLTKSNLLSYKGIILPQNASIDINSDKIISLEDFEKGEISRTDLEFLIDVLIKNDSLNGKMKDLPNVSDYKGQGQTLQGGLIDGFSLGCMFTNKVSGAVCDKFLDIFYKYGKYYNLSSYEADLLKLVKEVKNQNKSEAPICDMVEEYVLHSGVVPSDVLGSVMDYCKEEDQSYYKKLVDFIDVDNSLGQPELSSKVFDDPDLNAYKLLSAQQSVYKILEGVSINKNFIVSYLNFVQNLINKDRGTYNYLNALYMDELYVFNMDELYDKLLKKGELSSDIKSQIDQINNGNFLLKNESLLAYITTPNIIVSNEEFTGSVVSDKTLEEIFSQYYSMTDRLKIRKTSKVSDTQLRVQTEIFSDKINSVAQDSLKATISLYRRDNVLYVDEIKISNQPEFSDILNVYASSSLVTFYAMIGYIDEQVGFWYKEPLKESDLQKSLCEQLRENKNIAVYNCDDSSISLYSGSVEYNFTIENGVLQSFEVSDVDLFNSIKKSFGEILFNKDNTPTIIKSIIEFKLDKSEQNNIEKKLQVIDQFRIHFKLVPDIYDIEGEDSIFLVEFTLGDEFKFHARYNVDTHLLTRISYYVCEKTLEIRNLTIEVSADNEAELTEILNNPRIFFTRANQAAFKKYQKMSEECEAKK